MVGYLYKSVSFLTLFYLFLYLDSPKCGIDNCFVMVYNKNIKKCEESMEKIYENRKNHRKIFSDFPLPTKSGDYIYFLRIGGPNSELHKIGTTNRPLERLQEHLRYYETDVEVLWFSPTVSRYTALRIEDRQKKYWIDLGEWDYINNDRFIIPSYVEEVVIKIKKEYKVKLR